MCCILYQISSCSFPSVSGTAAAATTAPARQTPLENRNEPTRPSDCNGGKNTFKYKLHQYIRFLANLQCVWKHLERPEVEGALRHGHRAGGDPPPLGGKQLAQEDVGHGAVAGRIRLWKRFCICSKYKVNCISQIRDRQIILFEYLNSNIQIPYSIQRFRLKLCGKLFLTSTNRQSASAVAAADALAPNTAAPSAASAAAAALEAAMPRAEHTRRVRRRNSGRRAADANR